MKLYAYRRAGKIELETCQLPPEAHVTDIGTIEVTEPPKPKEPIKTTVPIVPPDDARGTFIVRLELPVDAKNIRCTYEIEE